MAACDIESGPMACYQCEQTIGGVMCDKAAGRCGKTPEVAEMQDRLMLGIKLLAAHVLPVWDAIARTNVEYRKEVSIFIVDALFSTLTNVSFDPAQFAALTSACQCHLLRVRREFNPTALACAPDVASWTPDHSTSHNAYARVDLRQKRIGKTVTGLQELILYGLKGYAAYYSHAARLGELRPEEEKFMVEALAFLASEPTDVPALLGMSLRVGEHNLAVMEALHAGNTKTYGDPTPTEVKWAPYVRVVGKCILITGHDLYDLHALLEQTKGTGIQVYTHGEMLPAHGYPLLKAYPHFAGHFGTAWQNQRQEFAQFPGPIVFTTNCLIAPAPTYKDRVYTLNTVGFPGLPHISAHDFSAVIAHAQRLPGFTSERSASVPAAAVAGSQTVAAPHKETLTVGFGLKTVLSVAGPLIEAAKSGAVRRLFLVGGCDGFEPSRESYYTSLARQIPRDCAILTLACGKYRLNHLDLGTFTLPGGITLPRLLDVGQCNDAHVAIEVAKALAGALKCGVNDLPLSLILSWFEQKAVVILLSLLHLGIRNIKLGPALPAFLSPEALAVLVEKFSIAPITTPEQDLQQILGTH